MGVKFGKGVVAKTGYTIVGLLIVWLGVIWRISDSLIMDAFLFAGALFITFVVMWWILVTQRFAERNPAQAMLDGAEFIEYKRFEAEAKGSFILTGPMAAEDSPICIGDGESR